MTILNTRAVICYILSLLLVPMSTLSAQTTPAAGAMLSPTGMVTINGELIKNSSALLGSETVSTGPDSGASIAAPGSNISLASNTVADYLHGFIQLKSGAILITSKNGLPTQVDDDLKFAPADRVALTKYEVQIDRCQVTVIARSGSVSLPKDKILEQGRTAQYSRHDCAIAALPEGTRVPAWVWLAGAAGAGTGIAIAVSGGSSPVSPSRP
jgi:hypothetical protein